MIWSVRNCWTWTASDACKFLKTNRLYFNGAITEPANLRDYVTEIAPFFMLDFAIIGGKFSFTPAIPVTSSGAISTGGCARVSPVH